MADRIGGSFAPPVTDDHLKADWPELIEQTTGLTRAALEQLHRLAKAHRKHPPVKGAAGTRHASGQGLVVPLTAAAQSAVASNLPTRDELAVYAQLFEPLAGDVRDAAFHLLWYATELSLGREPMTTDKL
jgi:hypothetical protein